MLADGRVVLPSSARGGGALGGVGFAGSALLVLSSVVARGGDVWRDSELAAARAEQHAEHGDVRLRGDDVDAATPSRSAGVMAESGPPSRSCRKRFFPSLREDPPPYRPTEGAAGSQSGRFTCPVCESLIK
jgi:hypothetical protein